MVVTSVGWQAYYLIHSKRGCSSAHSNQKLKKKDIYVKQFLKKLAVEDAGQDLIEYALVAALVGLGAVAAMKGLSNNVGKTFNGVGNSLTNAVA